MAITKVLSGRLASAMRIMIHGYPKVGKTTSASEMDDPLFISGESGDGQLNVKRYVFDEKSSRYWPQKWEEVLSAVQEIAKDPSGFKSLVFDGFGAIEKLAAQYVCTQNKWANLGTPGYGKGETALLAEIQKFLRLVEDVWSKGIAIAFVCHSRIAKVKSPSGEEYTRYEPALTNVNNGDVSGLLVGWCDAVLFAQLEVEVTKTEKKFIGDSTGRHVFKTRQHAQWVAGCRYSNVPPVMDLSMPEFKRLISEGQDVGAMTSRVTALVERIADPSVKADAAKWLASPAAKNIAALCRKAEAIEAYVAAQVVAA